jgi:CRISPR-associated protein Cas1
LDELPLLPISSVAEVAYCPRNFYYRVVEGARDTNVHMIEGSGEAERRAMRQHLARADTDEWREVWVTSERLGIIGKVDALRRGETLVPVEFKHGELRDSLHDDIQVAALGLALEEETGESIVEGVIYYGGSKRSRRVLLDDTLRDAVMQMIRQARSIVDSGSIPPPVADERCYGCALFARCQPEEVAYLQTGRHYLSPHRPLPAVNLNRVLYVDQRGGYIKKSGEELVVTRESEPNRSMPMAQVDDIVLVGNVALSSAAIRAAAQRGIRVSLLSSSGRLEAVVVSAFQGNGALRVAQYARALDESWAAALAREVVRGKVMNMRTLLRRYGIDSGNPAVRHLTAILPKVATADRDALLGLEGQATRAYFEAWANLLPEPWTFDHRNRRPPRDPVNALLSLGYSLLTKDVTSALLVAGLDPWVGYYHTMKYGRPALALDVMEEFRPVLVDTLVVSLLSRRRLSPEDFEQRGQAVLLTDSGRKTFFRAYEARKNELARHPVFHYEISYVRAMETQARFLAKVIQHDLPAYRAYRWR